MDTAAPALRRAMFLDRDGTLNVDKGYVHRQEDWQWLPGVPEALRRFKAVASATLSLPPDTPTQMASPACTMP